MQRFITSAGNIFSHNLFKTYIRNLFIVSLEYKVPLDQVDKHIEAHRLFLEECYKSKSFILSGRKVPRTGGLIIASTKDRYELDLLLDKDPFKKFGIADYHITEFIPTMHDSECSNIVENDLFKTKRL